jgi:hypothetical protein
MRRIHLVVSGVLLAPLVVLAQSVSTGKYVGRIEFPDPSGKTMSEMTSVTLDQVEGGKVKGSVYVPYAPCREDVAIVGRVSGDTLTLWGKGSSEACGVHWDLKVAGNTLAGKSRSGRTSISVSK